MSDSIAAVLKSSGPVVTCVLLQHMRPSGRDAKPHAVRTLPTPVVGGEEKDGAKEEETTNDTAAAAPKQPPPHPRPVLTELIREIPVDTTPGKRGVQTALGGMFTFVGQYPDQGVVLMARADQFVDVSVLSTDFDVPELIALCKDNPNVDYDALGDMATKEDLVTALTNAQRPVNPHVLQPPLHELVVRGDILVMRVSGETEEEEDTNAVDESSEAAMAKALSDFSSATAISNEDFFLNYTKDEYVAFASRTDVVAPERPPEEEESDVEEEGDDVEEEENEDEDEDEDGDYDGQGDGEESEEDKIALLNLILGEVLKKFRRENDRGPDSEELLALRSGVAEKLGVTLPEPTPSKRSATDDAAHPPSPKKIKFKDEEINNDDSKEDDTNGKPEATE